MIADIDFTTTTDPIAGAAALAGLVVASTFVIAAVGKLLSPSTTIDEFRSLAVPVPHLSARVVPVSELAMAAALVLAPAFGGPAAVIALVAFTIVLIRVVRSGRTVSCGCLGALDRGPVSSITVGRNAVLIALAAVAATVPLAAGATGAAVTLPRPSLALQIIVTAGTAAVIALVVGQLIALRRELGRIWSVALAGETDRQPNDSTTNDAPTAGSPLEVLAT